VTVLPDVKSTKFRQLIDFYLVTLVLHHLWGEDMTVTAHDKARNKIAADLLKNSGRGVDEVNESIKGPTHRNRSTSHSATTCLW
jgi:hypothetical protein